MKTDIKKRIKELDKEIAEHQKMLMDYQQSTNKLKAAIVSKSGAVIELKKLLKIKEVS